jgi:hypothetical protein
MIYEYEIITKKIMPGWTPFFEENKELLKNETTLFDMSRDQSYRDFLHPKLVSWLDNE